MTLLWGGGGSWTIGFGKKKPCGRVLWVVNSVQPRAFGITLADKGGKPVRETTGHGQARGHGPSWLTPRSLADDTVNWIVYAQGACEKGFSVQQQVRLHPRAKSRLWRRPHMVPPPLFALVDMSSPILAALVRSASRSMP